MGANPNMFRRMAFFFVLFSAGCAKVPPPVTVVEGVVLLNDQPLPMAQVEFVPDLKDFGAELNSTAVTDEKGRFSLTCNLKSQPGAVVAKHWVLVTDPAIPENLRGQDAKTQAKLAEYQRKLTNRPIPPQYATVGKTPINVEVTANQKEYMIKLSR